MVTKQEFRAIASSRARGASLASVLEAGGAAGGAAAGAAGAAADSGSGPQPQPARGAAGGAAGGRGSRVGAPGARNMSALLTDEELEALHHARTSEQHQLQKADVAQ
jgi:hypothetical protein